MAKKRKTKKKRTISPEHLKKMQEGREQSRKRREREKLLEERGLNITPQQSKYQRMLDNYRKKS